MRVILLIAFVFISQTSFADKRCTGKFVNPMNICWKCLFPLSIGNQPVVKNKDLKDTKNPASPIGTCGSRVGLNIGYWEPMALVDVTDMPYCLVNLGGHKLNLGKRRAQGGTRVAGTGLSSAFYNVHWYKYPVITWLNLLTSGGCYQGGDFDVAYMTELDPLWNDSEMNMVINPEAVLFSNPVANTSCLADSISSGVNKWPLDYLFWCAGSQGSMYPLNGHVSAPTSPVQSSLLLAERMAYKMHRELLLTDSTPVNGNVCSSNYFPILPKSRYRYEMVNQVVDGKHCYPFGYSSTRWEAGKIKPNMPEQYGYLIWRKRNCTYL
jgi:conjugal transfer pilus assembly protein TraU